MTTNTKKNKQKYTKLSKKTQKSRKPKTSFTRINATQPDWKLLNGYIDDEKRIIINELKENTKSRKFKRSDLLLATSYNDLNSKHAPLKYRLDKNVKGLLNTYMFMHLGQRKLFITELYMLCRYLKSPTDKAVMVYAGAAAGVHFPYLSSIFPNVDMHLYDPAAFSIKPTSRIHIYNEFFTDDIAKSWGPGGETRKQFGGCDFFLCDIRVSISGVGSEKAESIVTEDMDRQEGWTKLIDPKFVSMLKFRPPYNDNKLSYLNGEILWQTWPPKSSGETRLLISSADIKAGPVIYNIEKYENICYQHNIIDRAYIRYNDLDLFNKVYGYDGCWDCRAEAETWKMYIELDNKNISYHSLLNKITKYMNDLGANTHRKLLGPMSLHGRYYKNIPSSGWINGVQNKLKTMDRDKIVNYLHKRNVNLYKDAGVVGYLRLRDKK